MSEAKQPSTFTVREVLWAFAALSAVAAILITFSSDHSAFIGLRSLSGYLTTTGLVAIATAWVVAKPGWRWPWLLIMAVNMVCGAVASMPAVTNVTGFFVVTIVWAALLAIVFFAWGRQLRKTDSRRTRDVFFMGGLTGMLAIALAIVPWHGTWPWQADDQTGTLTGISLGVGIFGGYVAIAAVYLAIASFDRPLPVTELAPGASDTDGTKGTMA